MNKVGSACPRRIFLSMAALGGVLLCASLASGARRQAPRMIADCESAGQWQGGEVDRSLYKEGRASVRWEHGKSPNLTLIDAPRDWTSRNAVAFWMHNATESDRYVMLIFRSDNPAQDGMDYYARKIDLDFAGWKRFEILRSEMGAVRHPVGWNAMSAVYFTGKWGGREPDPENVVHIDAFEMIDKEGPMEKYLDAEALFDEIDLDWPGLEKVKAAVEKEDYAAAKHEMAEYLRERKSPPQATEPPERMHSNRWHHPTDGNLTTVEVADKAVAGEIAVVKVWHKFPDGRIDWHFNATENRDDMPYNQQWISQLQRMQHWRPMILAYEETGDEKYARAWVEQMRSWIKDCPRLDAKFNAFPSFCWRTINVGIRMLGIWDQAFHAFLHSPSFTDEAMMDYLQSCIVHADHLRRNHTSDNNWLAMEMNGLYTVAVTFPELKRAREWKDHAIEVMHAVMKEQFLPDGAQVELTPGYHGTTLGNAMSVPEKARRVGLFSELPEDFIAMAEKAYAYYMWLAGPEEYKTPHFNDSGGASAIHWCGKGLEYFPHRQDFRWMATEGKEGKEPDHTSHAFDWAGYFVMRSGWQPDANYLCFDAGPLGMSHVHQDKLNVVAQAYGRRILYDNGGGEYEKSKWRYYSIDTFAHNTILVDGMPQRRYTVRHDNVSKEPIDVAWQSNDRYDFAVGVYEEPYSHEDEKTLRYDESKRTCPAQHSRRVLFVKPDLFVVVDTLTSLDGKPHTYQARWQLIPTETAMNDATKVLATTTEGRPNLAVAPLLTEGLAARAVVGQDGPDKTALLGWNVKKRRVVEKATTLLHEKEAAGRTYLITLLIPLRTGEGDPVASTEATGEASARAILKDGRRWAVDCEPDPRGPVRFEETLADGSAGRVVAAGR